MAGRAKAYAFFAILMENTGQKEVALLHWMMMMAAAAAARVFHAVMTWHDHYCQEEGNSVCC